ncbi:MAG: RNA methyltransferase [bacterium]
MQIIPITTLDLPELEPYRTLRRPLEHRLQGIFVAEGERVVRRLLESNLLVRSVLFTPERLAAHRELLERKNKDIQVYIAGKKIIETIVGINLHQGIMAVAEIPKERTLEEVLANCTPPVLLVAVDGLMNAENLGVLVRNCAAFGVHALIVGETSSSPWLRRAVRNSMGTIFRLPVVHVDNLVEMLTELRTRYNITSIVAHPHTPGMTLETIDYTKDCCIVFGSEGEGISSSVLEACDTAAAIQMAEGVDSLNVASASAVFLYEAIRQRGKSKRKV